MDDPTIRKVLRHATGGNPDSRLDDHWDIERWEWPQGVGLYAVWKLFEATGAPQHLAFLEGWWDRHLAGPFPVHNVNTTAPLLTLAHLAARSGDPVRRQVCLDWARWIVTELPRTEEGGFQHVTSDLENPQQLWADTLFMVCLFLAACGRFFDRPDLTDEAGQQFLLHHKYLSDPATGLWFHGWTFAGRHHFGQARWARGNAWFTAASVEFLSMVPEGSRFREPIRSALEAQVRALAACQAPGGLWHTLLDHPDTYTESSASAAIAYGILAGTRLGYLEARWRPVGLRAAGAVAGQIDAGGLLQGVSYGTALGSDLDHYRRIAVRPTAYGQGLALLMLVERGREG